MRKTQGRITLWAKTVRASRRDYGGRCEEWRHLAVGHAFLVRSEAAADLFFVLEVCGMQQKKHTLRLENFRGGIYYPLTSARMAWISPFLNYNDKE